jgi:tetratricopeptide (TPR) repeat protein
LSDSTAYAGMQACRQCHEEKYQSFIRTGMGMSFDTASRKKSSANFDHAKVFDHFKNFYYEPYWSANKLYVNEFRLEGRDTSFQRREQINYIIGSGQHTNSHMMNVNGYVTQVPVTFYTQKGTWDLPPGFENGFNSRFNRKIELECMSCHNSYPEIVLGSENKYTSVPNGISCERCHGPGADHVRKMHEGKVVDVGKEIDYTIVNPAKLPINLQLDVCQRCHIQGNAVLKPGKSFYDFRPGMQLSNVMDVYMPVYAGNDEEHIMASHAERMKQSKCFIESIRKSEEINPNKSALYPYQNAMTCVSCHNPHVSVKETEHEHFNNVCRSCHYGGKKVELKNEVAGINNDCTASIKTREAVNDNCVSCHMPRNNTIDIPHVTTTDHFIRKPVKKEEVKKIKEFVTLACINNPQADRISRGIAFLNYFEKFESGATYLLDSAKKYLPDSDTLEVRANFMYLIRLEYLRNNVSQVVHYTEILPGVISTLSKKSFSNDDAWTSYRIGESYMSVGNVETALTYFQNAATLAPYQLDFRSKLSKSQFEMGRVEDARKNLQLIIDENPDYASAYVSLGYIVLSVDHDVQRADQLYDKALSLDPDNEQAMFNKAASLMYLNRNKESRLLLQKLLKRNPEHQGAKTLLYSLSKN